MRLLPALALLASVATPAAADEPIATYAIVVGSNPGGPGQADLRYAETDAARVGQLLIELGGYKAGNVDVVVHPTPEQLRARIAKLGDKLAEDARIGRPSRVFFYYSGHARSTALDLGKEELPLAELRQRLFGLPAKLTVVVLDACQSGAFSRVKGAEPAADFSFNSRTQLDASGVAVLASSSGSELSQESEQLKSSYFTHHLLVGMRGASDANKDGLVTIDEAYRYAYHQTLLATSETAVGGQHVSLEVDLKGHGDVPLSFPRAATKFIELPASLEGKTLVQDKRAKTVVAETHKAKGAPVRIAVAPGDYEVIVREGTTLSRCSVGAGGTVELASCERERLVASTTKGGEDTSSGRVTFARPNRIELLAQVGGERRDAYTDTLEQFGYEKELSTTSQGLALVGLRRRSEYVWVGGLAGFQGSEHWSRPSDGLNDLRFSWVTYNLAAVGRLETAFGDSGMNARIKVYAQAFAGLGIARDELRDQSDMVTHSMHVGPVGAIGAGLLVGRDDHSGWLPGLGFSVGYQGEYSPVLKNDIGDRHAVGGHRLTLGLSYGF
jgi:hypothetical protein